MHRVSQAAASRAALRHHQPLVIVLAAATSGIVLDKYAQSTLGLWMGAALLSLLLWFAAARVHRSCAAACALLAACGAAAGAWHHCCWHLFSANDVGRFAVVEGRPVALEATVRETPRIIEPPPATEADEGQSVMMPPGYSPDSRPRTRFEIEVSALRDDETWIPVVGFADAQIDGRLEDVKAGDRVRFFGKLSASPQAMNPGEFDFAAHYRAERKLCIVRVASPQSVSVMERARWWDLAAHLSQMRAGAHRTLLANVRPDQVGFASALLLGYRDLLARSDNWAFFRTGTVHVLSISGLHIGMLALFLHAALRVGWLRRTTAIVVTVAITATYALVIDAEPPAVRAVMVVVLVAVASLFGRRALSFNVLAASALLVLAINPCDLFRAGPQLSFLAAAVLAWRAEQPRRRDLDDDSLATLGRSRARLWFDAHLRGFGEGLLLSSLIFLVMTPLVAYRFHIVSPISLLLTPLLALPVAVGLFSGFLTLTIGWLIPPSAPVFGAVCGWLLWLIDYVVMHTQFWKGAAFWLPGPALWQVWVFYGLVAAWMWAPPRRFLRPIGGLLVIGWCVTCLIPRHALPPDVAMRTTFISVGHGLSVLVERSDGQVWLYDCGRMQSPEGAARSISAVLWTRGVTRLDALMISHADADHYNGIPYVLEQFRVAKVVLPMVMRTSAPDVYAYLTSQAGRAGVPVVEVSAGDLPLPDSAIASLQLWHPMPERFGSGESDNADSIVALLQCHGRRILLTGDIEGEGLRQILKRPPLDCDLVLAPHHGSSRSNPPGLANWSNAEWVVVSGTADSGGIVRKAYEATGAEVLETTRVGAVTVTVRTDGNMAVDTFRER
ncbi:MAG: hypothetical protein C0483_11795 [Pirellula sp.]|nr:hypothetical protein [Pirellula sp.]